MIPQPISDAGLVLFLIACVALIVAGYRADRRNAIADARRRHPSGRGR